MLLNICVMFLWYSLTFYHHCDDYAWYSLNICIVWILFFLLILSWLKCQHISYFCLIFHLEWNNSYVNLNLFCHFEFLCSTTWTKYDKTCSNITTSLMYPISHFLDPCEITLKTFFFSVELQHLYFCFCLDDFPQKLVD